LKKNKNLKPISSLQKEDKQQSNEDKSTPISTNMIGNIFERFNTTEAQNSVTGVPLILFEDNYLPQYDVHEALQEAMGIKWRFGECLKSDVIKHIETSVTLLEMKSNYNLSDNESAAITYYTCDVRTMQGTLEECPFKQINSTMITRDLDRIRPWKSFLYYLLSGLNKLPSRKETVYRAIDKPITSLSKQYKKGFSICWIGFSSTSLEKDLIKNFVDKPNQKGTYMIIKAIEGRDISGLSKYPSEAEIILLPNSQFMVEDILSNDIKLLLDIPSSMDVIVLTQIPTTENLIIKIPKQLKQNLTLQPNQSSTITIQPKQETTLEKQLMEKLDIKVDYVRKLIEYGITAIEDFEFFTEDDWKKLDFPPFVKAKILRKLQQFNII